MEKSKKGWITFYTVYIWIFHNIIKILDFSENLLLHRLEFQTISFIEIRITGDL